MKKINQTDLVWIQLWMVLRGMQIVALNRSQLCQQHPVHTIRILQRRKEGRESLANALEVEKTSGPLVSHRYATPRWNGAAFLSCIHHMYLSQNSRNVSAFQKNEIQKCPWKYWPKLDSSRPERSFFFILQEIGVLFE